MLALARLHADSHWNWDVWYGDMKPYKGHKYRHDYWYLVRRWRKDRSR